MIFHKKHSMKNYNMKKYNKKRWAGTIPLFILTAACMYVMDAENITKNTILDAAVTAISENLGYQAARSCIPVLV